MSFCVHLIELDVYASHPWNDVFDFGMRLTELFWNREVLLMEIIVDINETILRLREAHEFIWWSTASAFILYTIKFTDV